MQPLANDFRSSNPAPWNDLNAPIRSKEGEEEVVMEEAKEEDSIAGHYIRRSPIASSLPLPLPLLLLLLLLPERSLI